MIKHTHKPLEKEGKKRSDSINHNESNSIELDSGQLFCGPASGRSQLLPPSHIPRKLCCGLYQNRHTGVTPQISPLFFQ